MSNMRSRQSTQFQLVIMKNAFFSPLTMKRNVFCASKNHIPRGKKVKIFTFAYGQAGSGDPQIVYNLFSLTLITKDTTSCPTPDIVPEQSSEPKKNSKRGWIVERKIPEIVLPHHLDNVPPPCLLYKCFLRQHLSMQDCKSGFRLYDVRFSDL